LNIKGKMSMVREKLYRNDFVRLMMPVCRELVAILDEMGSKVDTFKKQIKKSRLPPYLNVDQVFLGK